MNYDKVPEVPDPPVRKGRRGLVAGLLVCLLLAGAAATWWQMRARPAAPPLTEIRRAAEILALEEKLESLRVQIVALPEDAPAAARRPLIEEALARQNELMRLRAAPASVDAARLAGWQAQLDELAAREAARQSQEAETAGRDLLHAKQPALAAEKLREALRLQREVNGSISAGTAKSYGREARLQQELEELIAGPTLAELQQALADARAAAAGGSWTDALRLFGRAREIQRQLNTDFPRSRYSDLMADSRIAGEMASLSASEAHAQGESFMAQAATAAGAGQLDEADRLYALAADRQQVINTQFAQSRFVSMEQLEKIDAERQTLRARPVMDAVRHQDETAAAHLRRRELVQAQRLVAAAREQMETAMRQYPKARVFDEEMTGRLNYLARRSAELETIQDSAYDLLLPRPGESGAALARAPVPQILYLQVMSTNPSRNAGRGRPVDSVNHEEATEFCRRLGWVLGAPVRLPAASDLRAAGSAPGFETGRMEEWLAQADDAQAAPVFTRDGKTRAETRTQRAATVGFRVVVGLDLLGAR